MVWFGDPFVLFYFFVLIVLFFHLSSEIYIYLGHLMKELAPDIVLSLVVSMYYNDFGDSLTLPPCQQQIREIS